MTELNYHRPLTRRLHDLHANGAYLWRYQGVTIPFFQRDRLVCVHEHFGTIWEHTLEQSFNASRYLPYYRADL